MVFKVTPKPKRDETQLISFRLPIALINALKRVAKSQGLTVTELVRQMLEHCIADIEGKRK